MPRKKTETFGARLIAVHTFMAEQGVKALAPLLETPMDLPPGVYQPELQWVDTRPSTE